MSDLNILIVLMGSLGDVARGLFVASQLKKQRPNCKITWLVEPKSQGLVELSNQVDRVIVFQRKQGFKGLQKLMRELRSFKFDVSLDLQRHFKSGLFAWLSAAPRRIGFPATDSKEFNWIFQTEYAQERVQPVPKLSQYFDQLACLGLKVSDPLEKVDLKLVESSLLEEVQVKYPAGYLVLVLSTSWASKYWPRDYYFDLCNSISSQLSQGIVLVGDAKDLNIAHDLSCIPKVTSTLNRTSLSDLVALVAHSNLVVGPDSGPGHIAALLDVPCVSIFGATEPRVTAPYGARNIILKSELACSACYLRNCPGLGTICMRRNRPAQVYDAICQILAGK